MYGAGWRAAACAARWVARSFSAAGVMLSRVRLCGRARCLRAWPVRSLIVYGKTTSRSGW